MSKVAFILWFFLIGLILPSCFKSEEFPPEPVISEPGFIITGETAILSFRFTDGDGDIGLDDNEKDPPFDTTSYYYYNLYCDYYEKDDQNGWQRGLDLAGDSITFAYRLERIIVKGKQRGIKGSMDVTMNTFKNPFSTQSDTIKFRIKLIDRALHESNVIETEPIIP